MCFLQRFLARRQSQRSMSQSTQEAQPLQAAPSTSIFHGVGTVTINGGTFILIEPAADRETPTSSREREGATTSGTHANETRTGEAT